MAEQWTEPTAEQSEQARLVQNEMIELVSRQVIEGIDVRVVIVGMAAAVCDVITTRFGPTAVAPWFAGQAAMINDLFAKPN